MRPPLDAFHARTPLLFQGCSTYDQNRLQREDCSLQLDPILTGSPAPQPGRLKLHFPNVFAVRIITASQNLPIKDYPRVEREL